MGFKTAAGGINQKGKTKGKNYGDTGPTVAIESGAKGKSKVTQPTGQDMRKMGRNLARAKNQKG
jgi:hypothetical protein